MSRDIPGRQAAGPRARQRAGLVPCVRRTLAAALAVVALTAVAGHYLAARLDAVRAAEAGLSARVRMAARQLSEFEPDQFDARQFDDESGAPPATAFAHRLFRGAAGALLADPTIVVVAVLDVQGAVLDQRPTGVKVTKVLAPPSGERELEVRPVNNVAGLEKASVTVAMVPRGPMLHPVMYVAVVSRRPAPDMSAALSACGLALGLVVVSLLTIKVAFHHLQARAFRPLGEISRRVQAAAERSPRLSATDLDELERITLGVEELCAELQQADLRAARLQTSVDSTVERETRHITRKLKQAEREAEIDPLTGLANRRFIAERLDGFLRELAARGARLAVIMFDVDHFKPLNDVAGHVAGDEVLRLAGELLRGSLREGDVAIRYGGDEFAVLLIDAGAEHARATAERLVRLFAQQVGTMNLPTHVTLSAGVASVDAGYMGSGEELLAHADRALYQSKHAGRNSVHVARV